MCYNVGKKLWENSSSQNSLSYVFLKILDFVFFEAQDSPSLPTFLSSVSCGWNTDIYANRSVVTVSFLYALHICAAVSDIILALIQYLIPHFLALLVCFLSQQHVLTGYSGFFHLSITWRLLSRSFSISEISILWGFSEYPRCISKGESRPGQGAMGHPLHCSESPA